MTEKQSNDMLLKEAYSLLMGLRENLPKDRPYLDGKYIKNFHLIVNKLEKASGHNLNDYKIQEDDVRLEWSTYIDSGGNEEAYLERFCDRDLLAAKIDALLVFFKIEPPEIKIGFSP